MAINPPRTLLVLKPSSFGDIIHTLPAVARLKAAWPECRISWLVNTEWMPLLAANTTVDEIIEFPRSQFRGWGGLLRMGRWIQREMQGRVPDLALDFQGLLRTALIARASGGRQIWGLDDAREGASLLYHRVAKMPPQSVHAVERYLALADFAIAETGRKSTGHPVPFYPLPPGAMPVNAPVPTAPYVLLHPFSRGKNKSFNGNQIDELIRKLSSVEIVLVGRGTVHEMSEFPRCTDLTNRTSLAELIWLTRNASFVISVDSGPAHLAAALGRPMVAIHSWSDPRKVGPYHPGAWVWKNGRLARVSDFPSMPADFFAPGGLDLKSTDLDAIAALATSP